MIWTWTEPARFAWTHKGQCLCVCVCARITSFSFYEWWQHFRRITAILYAQKSTNEPFLLLVSQLHLHKYIWMQTSTLSFSTILIPAAPSRLAASLLASPSCPLSTEDQSSGGLDFSSSFPVMTHSRIFSLHSSLTIHSAHPIICNMNHKHLYIPPTHATIHTPCLWATTRLCPEYIIVLIIFNHNMAFNFENYDTYINESPNQLALQASPITADLKNKQTAS